MRLLFLIGHADQLRLERRLVFEAMGLRHRLTGDPPVSDVDTTNECRLSFTGAFQTEIGKQFEITKRDVCERLSGRAGVRRGHVCHAIMRHTFFHVNWFYVCRGARSFHAAPWSIAMSTKTLPGRIFFNIARVISFGAFAPGTSTAPISRSVVGINSAKFASFE